MQVKLHQSSEKSWEAKLRIWIIYEDGQGREKTAGGIVQLHKCGFHLQLQNNLDQALRSAYLLRANSNRVLENFREIEISGRLCEQSSSLLLLQVSDQNLHCWLFYH